MKSYNKLISLYADSVQQNQSLRLGQFFCNRFLKKEWPELYYSQDFIKSSRLIKQWLKDNHYENELPRRLK